MNKAGWSSCLVAVTLLAIAVTAEAQQAKKIPRIGYLFSSAACVGCIPARSARSRLYRGEKYSG